MTAAVIVRRHFSSRYDYAVSTIQFIASAYGLALAGRAVRLVHRLNTMQGLTPEYYAAYTKWVRR